MTDKELEVVRKATVAMCNLIDCFNGVEYRTHAEFSGKNGCGRNPYTVAEYRDAIARVDDLKAILNGRTQVTGG